MTQISDRRRSDVYRFWTGSPSLQNRWPLWIVIPVSLMKVIGFFLIGTALYAACGYFFLDRN